MHDVRDTKAAIAGLDIGATISSKPSGAAKLTTLHREMIDLLPSGGQQEVCVILATLHPGDRTPYHTHRFPVTLYMLEGVFTLELADRPPVHIAAGEVFVEPANIAMTGRNLSADIVARMVIFYACEPDTPFADPV